MSFLSAKILFMREIVSFCAHDKLLKFSLEMLFRVFALKMVFKFAKTLQKFLTLKVVQINAVT